MSSRTTNICEINQNQTEKPLNIYKNTKNIAANFTSNISNKISQFKQNATSSVNSKFNTHHTSPCKKQYDETPIKTKTQQVFVPKSSNPIQLTTENNHIISRLNRTKETRISNSNTLDGSSSSSSGLSDISSLANSSDTNSSNAQKLNLVNSSRINSSNSSNNSNGTTQQTTENSNKSNNMVSKLKLDYLQKQHRDSGFIDDKCLSSLNTMNDQIDESMEQYGRPPGPLIYSQDGYFVLEHQFKPPILPKQFSKNVCDEKVENFELDKVNECTKVSVPLSIMKSAKGQQIKQTNEKNLTRTVSFGKVEENPISPRNVSINNSTVTFNNDESSCWMTRKEIKLSNDFYKMPYFNTNESGQILNDIEKISPPQNSLFKNDQQIEKNDNEDSIASVSAMTNTNSENNSNRTFADALQKASLIEDIITRRNKIPPTNQRY